MSAVPARLAEDAAEAVRALNHATLPGSGGLMFPADAYETAGALAVLVARLPQALAQLSAFLQAETEAGQIIIAAGPHVGDPGAAVSAACRHLDGASAAAGQLQQALDAAQQALTWGAAKQPDWPSSGLSGVNRAGPPRTRNGNCSAGNGRRNRHLQDAAYREFHC